MCTRRGVNKLTSDPNMIATSTHAAFQDVTHAQFASNLLDVDGPSLVEGKTWFAFFLPKRTPSAIVQKLHDAVVATIDTPAVQTRMKDYGAELVGAERRSPEYLQKFVESEIAKWAIPINASGAAGQ
jgi:hypothetical protein